MIIPIDTEKAFDKIQHIFRIKTHSKVTIEGIYLNILNTIYDKPIANIILPGEKLNVFSLRSEIRMSTSITFIQHSTGSPSHPQQSAKKKFKVSKL